MRNFQDTFETHKQSFISAFSICMTVSLKLCLKLFSSRMKDMLFFETKPLVFFCVCRLRWVICAAEEIQFTTKTFQSIIKKF